MKLLCLFLTVISFSLFGSVAKRLQYGNDWNYQTILVNGKEVQTSYNASGGSQIIYDRYEAIRGVLKQYNRPFTILDLGANNGFFSLKIAEEFDAVCVMVDGSERLTEICTLNTDRNKIIHFQKRLTQADIIKLAELEHFDVVLSLLVLHHVDNWRLWLDALFKMSDNLIIETPAINDPINKQENTKKLASYLTALPSGKQIGQFPRGQGINDHMLWFCQNQKSFDVPAKQWGISPATFFLFNGAYPTKSYVNEIDGKIKAQNKGKGWVLQGVDYYLK